jgi:small subunit ribosomal protein S29e
LYYYIIFASDFIMGSKDLANTHPNNNSKGGRKCRVSGRKGGNGLIRKYGIDMKRQIFREKAKEMGWSKYS